MSGSDAVQIEALLAESEWLRRIARGLATAIHPTHCCWDGVAQMDLD